MIELFIKLKNILETEKLEEKYSEEYNVLSMIQYEQELNEKASETRKNISDYFTGLVKEEK